MPSLPVSKFQMCAYVCMVVIFISGCASRLGDGEDGKVTESFPSQKVVVKESDAKATFVGTTVAPPGKEATKTKINVGYVRLRKATSFTILGKIFEVNPETLARLNNRSIDSKIAANELVLIPLGDEDTVELLSKENLLSLRKAAQSAPQTVNPSVDFFKNHIARVDKPQQLKQAVSDDTVTRLKIKQSKDELTSLKGSISSATPSTNFFDNLGMKVNELMTEEQAATEARTLLNKAKQASDGNGASITEDLSAHYAQLAGRTVVDAGVETVRALPWVKTLEVEYKIPIGEDRFSVGADLLVALHELDDNGHFVFSQLGARYKADRLISNLGLGYRWLSPDGNYMLGTNAFLDYDFMGKHARAGVGVEAKTKLLDFFANAYLPITPWKKAYNLDYLEERAASGYDIGLVGRLPFLQSVDWQAKYFKWFGENVDLYSNKKYMDTPDGVELSAKWNPYKFFDIGVTHSRAMRSSLQETRIEGQFSISFDDLGNLFELTPYKTGTPINERMAELVNRQNEMVYERRVSGEGQALGITITKFERR